MNDIQLSYIAGFFDGEGSINLLASRRKRHKEEWRPEFTLTIAIGQKDGATLDWIKENLGGNICKIKRDGSFFWYASNRKAEEILRTILPHLQYKKPQAELALKFYDERQNGFRRKITEKELKRREKIREKLIQLKKEIIESRYAGTTTKRTDPKGM